MKGIIQAAITVTVVVAISATARWAIGEADYLETMVSILWVVVVQDILFGKRR